MFDHLSSPLFLQDAIREAKGHLALVEALKMHQGHPGVAERACAALHSLGKDHAAIQVTSTGTPGAGGGDVVYG
jgi:hypothetical protein